MELGLDDIELADEEPSLYALVPMYMYLTPPHPNSPLFVMSALSLHHTLGTALMYMYPCPILLAQWMFKVGKIVRR